MKAKGFEHNGDGKRLKAWANSITADRYGQQLGIDFENNPEVVAIPIGLVGRFWSECLWLRKMC